MKRMSAIGFGMVIAAAAAWLAGCSSGGHAVPGDIDYGPIAEWEQDSEVETADGDTGYAEWDGTLPARDAASDTAYQGWMADFVGDGLSDVRAFANWPVQGSDLGGVYIGTGDGLYFWNANDQTIAAVPAPSDVTGFRAVSSLVYSASKNTLYLLATSNTGSGLYSMRIKNTLKAETGCHVSTAPTSLAIYGDSLLIGTLNGIYEFSSPDCNTNSYFPQGNIVALSSIDRQHLAVMTSTVDTTHGRQYTLHTLADGIWSTATTNADTTKGLLAGRPTDLAYVNLTSPNLRTEVWITFAVNADGTGGGLQRLNRNGTFTAYPPGANGLPLASLTSIFVPEGTGEVWSAGPNGVLFTTLNDDLSVATHRAFYSHRWLRDDAVVRVHRDNRGAMWFAHTQGVTRLNRPNVTLAAHAEQLEARLAERHLRAVQRKDGTSFAFVAACRQTDAAPGSGCVPETWGDDAFWNGLYAYNETLRALSLPAGASRDAAVQKAKAAVLAELEFASATQLAGLPAKRLMPRGSTSSGAEGESWYRSDFYDWLDGAGDEALVGQLAAYALFYDTLADEATKTAIRTAVAAMQAHLQKNNWQFIGYDAQPTPTGRFGSEDVTGATGRQSLGGVRALEILAFLRFAHHVSGKAEDEQTYLKLAEDAGYANMTVRQASLTSARQGDYAANLRAALSADVLLRLEPYASFRRLYLQAQEDGFTATAAQRNPLQRLVTLVYSDKATSADQQTALDELRAVPVESVAYTAYPDAYSLYPRHWKVETCSRADVTKQAADADGLARIERVLSPSERRLARLDTNPYTCEWQPATSSWSDGAIEDDGLGFLLPYWYARYHNLLDIAAR